VSEIKKTLGESKNSKKDSLPGRVNGDLGRSVVMPFFVLVLAISSLIVAVVAFHSDNTSTQYQSGSDGLSTPGDMYSVASSPEASGSEYQMSSWAPIIPELIHSDPYVIFVSLTIAGPEPVSIDMSPRMYIYHDWMTVPPDAIPVDIPKKVGIFDTNLEGSLCTFSFGSEHSGKGEVMLTVPVMYQTLDPVDGFLQVYWLIHINYIDQLVNSEGSFYVQ
jgi:hypothetical protein